MSEKPEDRVPLTDASRTVYYDAEGLPYYTEWQLLPPAGPPAAAAPAPEAQDGGDTRKVA